MRSEVAAGLETLTQPPPSTFHHAGKPRCLPILRDFGEAKRGFCPCLDHAILILQLLELQIKATLENVKDLRPSGDDYTIFGKIKCTSCHEDHNKEVGITSNEENELTRSKGTANFVWTCGVSLWRCPTGLGWMGVERRRWVRAGQACAPCFGGTAGVPVHARGKGGNGILDGVIRSIESIPHQRSSKLVGIDAVACRFTHALHPIAIHAVHSSAR